MIPVWDMLFEVPVEHTGRNVLPEDGSAGLSSAEKPS